MKKLLLATLFLGGLSLFASSASADCYERVFVGYDRCGRPVYEEVYRPSYRNYEERPVYQPYYESRRPYVYVEPRTPRYRDYDDDRGYSKSKKHRDEPRFRSPLAFLFGF
jgi:hypothetical protein